MGSFEKVFITIVLVADLFAIIYFGGQFAISGSLISHGKHDTHESLILAHAPEEGAHAKVAEAEPEFDWAAFVPDLARGAQISAKCKACHTFDAGGDNRIGPNLWHIVGAEITHKSDFSYSAAFNDKKGEIVWDREALDAYLKNPKKFIPGTKMAFPGIRKQEERAHLIAWLETLK